MRSAAVVSFIVFLASCGVDDGAPVPSEAVATKTQALTLPRSPTQLVAASWRPRFIPATAQSAYLVVVADPLDRSQFLAWGYDVRAQASFFFFRGDIALDLSRLNAKVAAEASSVVIGGTAPDFSWGVATQLGRTPKPGDPPVPPGADWSAWSSAAWNSAAALDRVATNYGTN